MSNWLGVGIEFSSRQSLDGKFLYLDPRWVTLSRCWKLSDSGSSPADRKCFTIILRGNFFYILSSYILITGYNLLIVYKRVLQVEIVLCRDWSLSQCAGHHTFSEIWRFIFDWHREILFTDFAARMRNIFSWPALSVSCFMDLVLWSRTLYLGKWSILWACILHHFIKHVLLYVDKFVWL